MFTSQELSKFIFSFLSVAKNWFLLSYRPLWFALKETIINKYPPVFKVLAPFFNLYSTIGLFFFLFVSHRYNSIKEAYKALFFIGLTIMVLPAIPTMLMPVGFAIINTMLMFKLIESLKNFLSSSNSWKTKNIFNSVLSDESILFSSLVIIFSLAAESLTPIFILGTTQGVNLFFKTGRKIYEYFMTPKNSDKHIDISSVKHDIVAVNTTEYIEQALDLLKDENNDYLLSENNNFYLRHAAEIGRWDVVLKLLKKPNIASDITCNDCAVISLALQQDQWNVIKKVIKNSFYIIYPNTEGKTQTLLTLLQKAINQNNVEIVNLIVNSGFYKHYAHTVRVSILFFGAIHNDIAILNVLFNSKKILRLLEFKNFSNLFEFMSDDTIKKMSHSSTRLIEYIQNTDWQGLTLFEMPIKHLIDKNDLSTLADCQLFLTNMYGFLYQKLKKDKLPNLFAARFIYMTKNYNQVIDDLNGKTTMLPMQDRFSFLNFYKELNLQEPFRIPSISGERIFLNKLIERISIFCISKAFNLKIKENPTWTFEDKKNALNSLTFLNNKNVKEVFVSVDSSGRDMSFADSFTKIFEKFLLEATNEIIPRLQNDFLYGSEPLIKEKIKKVIAVTAYHFTCMGENATLIQALNNTILKSNCVIQDIHFEQECPFAEETPEQKLYIILANKLNEEAKKYQAKNGLQIQQLQDITKICKKLVIFQLENKELTVPLQNLKRIILDINTNELETFLIAEAIKVKQENELAPITPQFNNILQSSRTDSAITSPLNTIENKVTQPSIF